MNRETQIQKYLQNQLSEKEHSDFLSMMENDSAFKEEVQMISDLYQVNRKEELIHIRSVLEEAEGEIEKKKSVKNIWKRLLLGFLLIAIIVSLYFISKGSPGETAIYASFYKTPTNTYFPVVRDGTTTNQALFEAFLAYEQNNFKKASDLFIELSDYNSNPEIQYYNAISLIELGNEEEAKSKLEAITTEDDYLKDEILWYSALLALKMGQKEEAKSLLNDENIDQKQLKWRSLLKKL